MASLKPRCTERHRTGDLAPPRHYPARPRTVPPRAATARRRLGSSELQPVLPVQRKGMDPTQGEPAGQEAKTAVPTAAVRTEPRPRGSAPAVSERHPPARFGSAPRRRHQRTAQRWPLRRRHREQPTRSVRRKRRCRYERTKWSTNGLQRQRRRPPATSGGPGAARKRKAPHSSNTRKGEPDKQFGRSGRPMGQHSSTLSRSVNCPAQQACWPDRRGVEALGSARRRPGTAATLTSAVRPRRAARVATVIAGALAFPGHPRGSGVAVLDRRVSAYGSG